MSLRISIDESREIPLIHLEGSLTLGPQLAEFSKRLHALLRSPGIDALLLEFTGVSEVDSAGLGELVILYTSATEQNCRLCLVNVPSRVVRLLEMTKLIGILPCFGSVESARQSLQSH